MNQMIQMLNDSNSRMRKMMKGGFDVAEMTSMQREFEGQIKFCNVIIRAIESGTEKRSVTTNLRQMNILDSTTAIDLMLGDPEVDKVKCPEHDDLITRAQCLDESGSPEYFERCDGCEIGAESKRMLLPDKTNGVA